MLVALLVVGACGGGQSSPATQSTSSGSPIPTGTPSPSASQTQTETPGPTAGPSSSPTPSPTASPEVPAFRHVYVIIFENREYSSIVGSKQAPYLNSLISRYGLATQFYAETHPSEPNYIALTSGGLQGTVSDGTYNLSATSLFDQIEAAGKTWHVYAQGYPGGCYTRSLAPAVKDGTGLPGEYVRKHNPAISYKSISGNPGRCANITRLTGFDPAAADFELIIPNQINDMHSSSVATGDSFTRAFLPEIIDSPAFADSVVFLTFDEGITKAGGGGRIATIVVSPGMTPGYRSSTPYTHYSMLRTIEQAWSLPYLGEASTATTMAFPY
jgi:hypothetical protein